jgi:hypothetical protein
LENAQEKLEITKKQLEEAGASAEAEDAPEEVQEPAGEAGNGQTGAAALAGKLARAERLVASKADSYEALLAGTPAQVRAGQARVRLEQLLKLISARQDAEAARADARVTVKGPDAQFGPRAGPKRVRPEETDEAGEVRLNPLWYRLADFKPTLLSRLPARWHFVISDLAERGARPAADDEIVAELTIGAEQIHTVIEPGELRELRERMEVVNPELRVGGDPGVPADNPRLADERLGKLLDNQGHPTVVPDFTDDGRRPAKGSPARISGEFGWNQTARRWEVTDKSGRYMSVSVRGVLNEQEVGRWLEKVAEMLTRRLGVKFHPVLVKVPNQHLKQRGPEAEDGPRPKKALAPTSRGHGGADPVKVEPGLAPRSRLTRGIFPSSAEFPPGCRKVPGTADAGPAPRATSCAAAGAGPRCAAGPRRAGCSRPAVCRTSTRCSPTRRASRA